MFFMLNLKYDTTLANKFLAHQKEFETSFSFLPIKKKPISFLKNYCPLVVGIKTAFPLLRD